MIILAFIAKEFVLPQPLPSSSPFAGNIYALKVLRTASKAYDSVATIFRKRDKKRLAEEIEAGAELWEEVFSMHQRVLRFFFPYPPYSAHIVIFVALLTIVVMLQHGNKGLMDLVLQAVTRFWVADLQLTYKAIPISQVAAWLTQEPREVESYIQSLIQSGHLKATIDKPSSPVSATSSSQPLSSSASSKQPSSNSSTSAHNSSDNKNTSNVLRFYFENDSTGPFAKTEQERYNLLATQVEQTNALAEQVKLAEARVTLTREYVEYLRRKRTQRNGADDGSGGGGGGDEMLVDGIGGGGGGMWDRDDGIGDVGMDDDDDDDDDDANGDADDMMVI